MELSHPFSISFLTFLIFLIILIKLLIKRSNSKNSSTNLPPGPWTLPLIGNIHQIIAGSLPPHLSFRNLANKYGDIMHLKLGEVSHIIVSSPEIAKQIMKTHDLNFCDRPNLVLSTILSYNATDIVFSPYGEYWRELRRICTIELLSSKRVQSFRSIREEEVSALVKAIRASELGSVVNLTEKIFELTYGIAARAAFGKKNRQYQDQFKSNMEEVMKIGGFCVADLYPSIGMVLQRLSKAKAKMEKLHREIERILQDIIDYHKDDEKRNYRRDQEAGGEDLVDVLLKLQQEKDSQYPITDDNIKAVIQDMFAGGGETISRSVLWGMAEMVKNPKVMKEAQDEVRRVFDSKGNVDEEDLHQLIYLKSVIKETLRLHPSLPLLVPRECTERCQINGYDIPAKSRVIVNAWAIGRDPRYWDEAETFKPERFLNSQIDFKGTHFEYLPFGAGRRMCPGVTFALRGIELQLAQLLYHFDWKLPNGMKNEELDMSDMTEPFGMTVRKSNDLYLIPIARQH